MEDRTAILLASVRRLLEEQERKRIIRDAREAQIRLAERVRYAPGKGQTEGVPVLPHPLAALARRPLAARVRGAKQLTERIMGAACGFEVARRRGARHVLGQHGDEGRPGFHGACRRSGGRGRRRWAGVGPGTSNGSRTVAMVHRNLGESDRLRRIATARSFQEHIEPLRGDVVAWLQEGAACPVKAVAGRCREILAVESALWTFAYVEGVEPTNHAGERWIRHGVMWRKTSFGTDGPSGSRFVERILTIVTTRSMQGRNVLDYIAGACEAALQGHDAPSLLPG